MGDQSLKNTGVSAMTDGRSPKKPLTDAAKRALAEAEERRKAAQKRDDVSQKEIGGQDGPDPIRYGDWEKDGIVSDF